MKFKHKTHFCHNRTKQRINYEIGSSRSIKSRVFNGLIEIKIYNTENKKKHEKNGD